jgi:uncharacterized Ntn-hydrolase superfamily protein
VTFSIAARCPRTRMLGVSVSSASLGSGAWVPSVKTATGAIASQAFGNPFFGIDGLRLLDEGLTAEQVVAELLPHDQGREYRQLLIVDGCGRTAAFTGSKCLRWASHQAGEQFVAGGNTLTGEHVLLAMTDAFSETGDQELPERLVRALEAGDAAGGDRRGRQSAALLVTYDQEYRYYDLRVDDHPDPVHELRRLFELRKSGRARLGDWRPTRESPLEPGFLERYEREAAAVDT